MKILALRVRNLASLAGDIAIDFEAPPLARAGLFAITGPTGAGKSTLLDALCLALYDELPRLTQGGDVRSVLRHGAADAHAEVDFVGRDGGRYRARWEVRRARNRSDGRIQAQTISLTDLATNVALGGTKRETLKAIEDKAGLDYDQFRRSVLLAQNDFDAFLRAKPDERAGLLELMTGTAIYGALSKAAYDRCKTEDAALKALDDELKRVNVLADDERAAIEAETGDAVSHAAHLADEVDGLAREIEWYRVAADLTARLAQADKHLTEAQSRLAEAQPERDRMAQVRRALSVAPQLAEADRLAAEAARLDDERLQAGRILADRRDALQIADSRREAARLADEHAEAAFKAAGPALDRAADLDTRLTEGAERIHRCRSAATQSAQLAEQARLNAERLNSERMDVSGSLDRLGQWIAAHGDRKVLAEQSDRWLEVIASHAQADSDHRTASARAATAAGALADLAVRCRADDDRAGELAVKLTAIGNDLDALAARLDRVDLEALDRRRDGLDAVDEALALLADLNAADQGFGRRARDLAERSKAAEARRMAAGDILTALDSALAGVRTALPEAQAALALAEAAASEHATVLRQHLLDGQPCPVCGSRDHPLDQAHSTLTGLLAAQRRRVGALEAERDDLVARHAAAAADMRSAAEMLAHAGSDAAALEAERQALAARRTQAENTAAELAERWEVAADRAACVADREVIAESLRVARADEAARRRLAQEQGILQQEARSLADRQAEAVKSRAALAAEESGAQADCRRAVLQMEQAAQRLEAPLAALPGWRDLLGDPRALAERISRMAAEWHATVAKLEAARGAERALASKCDSAAAALENARLNAQRDRKILDDEQAGLDRLAAARGALFDGVPTSDIRTRLNEARRLRKDEFRQAQDAWATSAQAHSAADSRATMLAAAQAANALALDQANAARDARLNENGFSLGDVREAMALGDGWMAAAEARQGALREADAAARAIAEERRHAEAVHLATGRPERGADELDAALPARTAERDAARDRVSTLRQRLSEDDRNRGAAEDTRRRISDQRKRYDLWKGMADLIGSADGKKFRLFAQGLTLDRLLGLANLHLAELTPRYVLQRAPGSDLDLQVIDRDMADEVRGVSNLSGGERFLVSLSLALGLASMTGSRTIAESLFIDEGFGALDAESLDVAIGALETLHASGRKVGVISHVQAMIDRIGVQVRVTKQGGGRSVVETQAA